MVFVFVFIYMVFVLFFYMEGFKEVEVKDVVFLSYFDLVSVVVYVFFVFGEVFGMRMVIGGVFIFFVLVLDVLRR